MAELSLGDDFTCVKSDQNKVRCWGENIFGQLGLGDNTGSFELIGDEPNEMGDNLTFVDFGTNFTVAEVYLGFNFACVKSDQGKVKCWGNNDSGRLGLGDTTGSFDMIGDEPNEMGDNLPFVDFGTKNCTLSPSSSPTLSPSHSPTLTPTGSPSQPPTLAPSYSPTGSPSQPPTLAPSYPPTGSPSYSPTLVPTNNPTYSPTDSPSQPPTHSPTLVPTNNPTNPTLDPTNAPTYSPSYSPTGSPSQPPSLAPTNAPTNPTVNPTNAPTFSPTLSPTNAPTESNDLTTEEIIGIGLGGFVGLIMLILFIMYILSRIRKYNIRHQTGIAMYQIETNLS